MKKIAYIGLILGAVAFFNTPGKAQYYYTSHGYAQDWRVPRFIDYTVRDHYYGYEVAHVKRHFRRGNMNYNVLLHRNGRFVELRFDHRGYVYRTIRHRSHYPLWAHNCNHHCGFQKRYYTAYYPKYRYNHNYYRRGHSTTVVVNAYDSRPRNHVKYHTNMHVERKQKSHHKNQKKQHVQTYQQPNRSEKQTRTRGSIRIPEQNNVQQLRSNSRSASQTYRQRSSTVASRSTTTSRNSGKVRSYRNERGSRER